MTRRPMKSTRAAGALAGSLMFAPAVIFMRLPMLATEARDLNPWRVETVRAVSEKASAVVEGVVAAQFSFAWSASWFWLELCCGRTPSILNGVAAERATLAALQPSARRVRANYRRLARRV